MKDTPLSNCEKQFVQLSVEDGKRLDGRGTYDYRKMKITFGIDRGCCHVELGKTRVLAQVSCEVVEPKQMRPQEGHLYVNVELSPMACPSFEAGRLSELGVEINRLLERCLKESRCVDLESLCIVAKEKVWQIRLDVHILNHDGNLIDCACLAGITALSHFRRPDVTVCGDEITIHPADEKDPVPLSVYHMPLCVTFAFFDKGKYLLVDPTDIEEKVMEGKMIIGMNKHREICTLQMTGEMLLLKDQVIRCSNVAVVKVKDMSELVQKALENDDKARAAGEKFGFASSIDFEKVTTNRRDEEMVEPDDAMEEDNGNDEDILSSTSEGDISVQIIGPGTGRIGDGGPSTWDVDMEDELNDEVTVLSEKKISSKVIGDNFDDDSEEEVTVILGKDDLSVGPSSVTTGKGKGKGKRKR